MTENKQHFKLFATLNWGKLHLFYLVREVCKWLKGTFLHYGLNPLEHSLHIGQTLGDLLYWLGYALAQFKFSLGEYEVACTHERILIAALECNSTPIIVYIKKRSSLCI